MRPRTLFVLSLVAIPLALLATSPDLFAAPPLPDAGGVPRLNPADVLNPEFPAVPASDVLDGSDWSEVPSAPAVAFDDAMARTLVWAGAAGAGTNAAPAEVAEPGFFKRLWPDGIDWVRTLKWVGGGVAVIAGVLVGKDAVDKVDLRDHERAPPAPAPLSPAALAAASSQAAGAGSAEVLNFAISGTFLGPVQVSERGQWTPGLTFAKGEPGRAGEISAFLSSDGTNRQGGGTWRATYGNEIAIAVPDGAYAGLATVQGANIVLSSGIVLRPQSGASAAFVRP